MSAIFKVSWPAAIGDMWLAKVALLFYVTILTTTSLSIKTLSPVNISLKDRIAAALTSAVSYMRDNYGLLNLDAITGLRIAQGN